MKEKKIRKRLKSILGSVLCVSILCTSVDITAFATEEEILETNMEQVVEETEKDQMTEESEYSSATEIIDMPESGEEMSETESYQETESPDAIIETNTEENNKNTLSEDEIVKEISEKRTENTKTFELENGNELFVNYFTPIHYETQDGWEDISYEADEGVNKEGEEIFTNIGKDFDIELPKELDENKNIVVKNGSYELSYRILGIESKKANKKEHTNSNNLQAKVNSVEPDVGNTEEIFYKNVMENTDLFYVLSSNGIKENIVIQKRPEEELVYQFEINAEGLQYVKEDNGTIIFYGASDADKTQPVFYFQSLFMYDSKNEYCEEIGVSIEQRVGNILLSYSPSMEWLADKKRVYPVTLDPIITQPESNRTGAEFGTLSYYDWGNYFDAYRFNLNAGKNLNSDLFFKKLVLPDSISNMQIVKARLNVSVVGNNNYSIDDVTAVMYAYQVEDHTVPNTIEERNENSIILDYTENLNTSEYEFDITSYMANPKEDKKLGIAVSLSKITESGNVSMSMCHPNLSANEGRYPKLIAEYRPIDSNSETKINLGAAGNIVMDDFTGNVRFFRSDLYIKGNRMPVTIGMNYNSARKDEDNDHSKKIRNSYEQTIQPLYTISYGQTFEHGYEYSDENGTRYYFERDAEGVFKCVTKDSYKLTVESGIAYTLEKDDHTYKFNAHGKLVSISDKAPTVSSINIVYDSSGKKIDYVTDGVGRRYQYVYDDHNRLVSIKYQAASGTAIYRQVAYTYDGNGMLSTVTTVDGKVIQYEWDNENLVKISNYDGKQLELSYESNKVSSWIEKINHSAIEKIDVLRTRNQVIYKDQKGHMQILQFDSLGNIISSQDEEGNAMFGSYDNYSQLISVGSVGKANKNYFQNASFENGTAGWIRSHPGYAMNSQEDKYSGYSSLKINSVSASTNQHAYQSIPIEAGKKYALSAYVKANITNIGKAFLFAQGTGIEIIQESEELKGSQDWKRIYVLIEANQNTTIQAGIKLTGMQGTVFADAFILEERVKKHLSKAIGQMFIIRPIVI